MSPEYLFQSILFQARHSVRYRLSSDFVDFGFILDQDLDVIGAHQQFMKGHTATVTVPVAVITADRSVEHQIILKGDSGPVIEIRQPVFPCQGGIFFKGNMIGLPAIFTQGTGQPLGQNT
jgi:hypothetical protein